MGAPMAPWDGLFATIPGLDRAARWLAALCVAASSAGCILTQDLPDPALDIPQGYKAARLANPDAPPTLDWWRGFRSRELTTLMEEAPDRQSRHRRRHRAVHPGRCAGAHRRRAAAAEPQRHRPADLCPHLGLQRQRPDQWRPRSRQLPGLVQRQLRNRFLGQEPRRRAGGGGDSRSPAGSTATWWR